MEIDKRLVKADYISGMKQNDIVDKYGVSINTLKSWIKRDGWSKDKKSAPKVKKNAPIKKSAPIVNIEVQQVIDNPDLTDKQKLFCLHYVKCFNATKAYQKAFGCKYTVANAEGYKLLVKPCVRDEINKLKQNKLNREMLSEHDIFQQYMDIAFSDLTDYVRIEDGGIELKDTNEIDGSLVSEISFGKTTKIKLYDRMRALDWLTKHIGMSTEEQRERLNLLKAQVLKAGAETDDDEIIKNMQGLAEILKHTQPNRNIEDFE